MWLALRLLLRPLLLPLVLSLLRRLILRSCLLGLMTLLRGQGLVLWLTLRLWRLRRWLDVLVLRLLLQWL